MLQIYTRTIEDQLQAISKQMFIELYSAT